MTRNRLVSVLVLAAAVVRALPAGGDCQWWLPGSNLPAHRTTRVGAIDYWHALAEGPGVLLGVGVQHTTYEVVPYLVALGATDECYGERPLLGISRLPVACQQIGVDGDVAYLAPGTAELLIVDLSEPSAPTIGGTMPLAGPCRDLLLDAERQLLITAEWDAVRVYATAGPGQPELVGSVPAAGAWSLARRGARIYAACANWGLRIIDTTDPPSPQEVSVLPLGGNVRDVAVFDDRALLVGPTVGLVVVDISTPALPILLHQVPCSGEADQVLAANGYAYVRAEQADWQQPGLHLYQLFATRAPRLQGSYFSYVDLGVIAAAGDCLLVGRDQEIDACLMQCGPVTAAPPPEAVRPVLHQAHPNPCNPTTTIRFTLTEPAAVDLRVYDVAGRPVHDLLHAQPLTAGPHDVVWNGRDASGRPVPSGVYVYRLVVGGYGVSRRVVVIQ